MSQAFLEMLELQLEKIEDYNHEVHGLIDQLSSLSVRPAPLKQQKPAKQSKALPSPLLDSRKANLHANVSSNYDIEPPSSPQRLSQVGQARSTQVQHGTLRSKSPAERQTSNGRGNSAEICKRVEDMIRLSNAKDLEVTTLLNRNVVKKDGIRKIERKCQELKDKETYLQSLMAKKRELEQQRDRLEAANSADGPVVQAVQLLELEIKALKEEVERFQQLLAELIKDRFNQDSADELRNYHLRLRLFVEVRRVLRYRHLELISDDFRRHRLTGKVFAGLKERVGSVTKLKLVADRQGLEVASNELEIIEERIVGYQRLQQGRSVLKECLDALREYALERLDRERLNKITTKYRNVLLKKKALNSFKHEIRRYGLGDPLEREKYHRLFEKVESSRLSSVFSAWRQLFVTQLQPNWRKSLKIKALVEANQRKLVFSSLKANRDGMRTIRQKIYDVSDHCQKMRYLRTWFQTSQEILRKKVYAIKVLNRRRLRACFKGIKRVLKNEQAERKRERFAILREELEQKKEQENLIREKILEEEKVRHEAALVKEMQKKLSKRRVWEGLSQGVQATKALEKLESIKRRTVLQGTMKIFADLKRDEERSQLIESKLPELRGKIKASKKQLVLKVLSMAAKIHKQKSSLIENLKSQVERNVLKRSLRGLKKNLISKYNSQMGQDEKVTFLLLSQSKQEEKSRLQICNENSFLELNNNKLQESLCDKKMALEAKKKDIRILDDKKMEMTAKLELVEKTLRDKQQLASEKNQELQKTLDEKNTRVVQLRKTLEELKKESKKVDAGIESKRVFDRRHEWADF